MSAHLRPAPVPPRWLHRVGGVLVRRWLRLETTGAHHIPATGGVVLAANHASHADILALAAASPRRLTYLGSSHLVDVRVLGPLLVRVGMVPVDRGTADRDVLALLASHLRGGGAVVVFPEGTRSRDGRVWRPRSGVARLALDADVPIVPVGLRGTASAWPVDQRPRWRPPPVRVSFGAPLAAPAGRRERRAFLADLHDDLVALSGAPAASGLLPIRPQHAVGDGRAA